MSNDETPIKAVQRRSTDDELAPAKLAALKSSFDLDLRAEALDIETLTVETPYGPVVVPSSMDDWVGNSFDLILEGRFREAMFSTVGPTAEEIARANFEGKPEDLESTVAAAIEAAEAPLRKLRIGQIKRIIDHVVEVSGVTPGESSSSESSSRSTGGRSKRTSGPSTAA